MKQNITPNAKNMAPPFLKHSTSNILKVFLNKQTKITTVTITNNHIISFFLFCGCSISVEIQQLLIFSTNSNKLYSCPHETCVISCNRPPPLSYSDMLQRGDASYLAPLYKSPDQYSRPF